MPGLSETLQHNPLFVFDALLASLGGLASTAVGKILLKRGSRSALSAGIAAIILGSVAVSAGGFGYISAIRRIDPEIYLQESGPDPAVLARFEQEKQIEARYVLVLSVAMGLFPLVFGVFIVRRAPKQTRNNLLGSGGWGSMRIFLHTTKEDLWDERFRQRCHVLISLPTHN